MYWDVAFAILRFLIWPIIIIGLIIFFAVRRRKRGHPAKDKQWYLRLALSKEDAVSQLFFLLAVFFIGAMLLALNRDFSSHFSWQTILLATSAAGIAIAYCFKVFYPLIFSLLGISSWWSVQASEWLSKQHSQTSAILIGLAFLAILFYSLGRLHEKEEKWKRFAMVYLILGLLFITGFLFSLSTEQGISSLDYATKGRSFFLSWQIVLSLALSLALLIGTLSYNFFKKLISVWELLAASFLTISFGLIAVLPQKNLYFQGLYSFNFSAGSTLTDSGVTLAIIINIVLFFELLGLIFLGYQKKETWLINLGVFFLFVLIIVKYFSWFFTFLDKSLFFIGAGLLLFVLGFFMEKGRRRLISSLKNGNN
jgi:hypothetical protein